MGGGEKEIPLCDKFAVILKRTKIFARLIEQFFVENSIIKVLLGSFLMTRHMRREGFAKMS